MIAFNEIPVPDIDNLTVWLRYQLVHIQLLCANGLDPRSCYMSVYQFLPLWDDLTDDQKVLITNISRTYVWALLASDTPNAVEINQILNKIQNYTSLALTQYKRYVYNQNELLNLHGTPQGQLVINICVSNEQYIVDMVGLPEGGNIHLIRSPLNITGERPCCPTKLTGACDNPQMTCEKCSIQNGRQACSVCAAVSYCDIYKAYSEMQHAFFLFKRTWENELPYEMALKGLRRNKYLAYGVYLKNELLAYLDIKETWEGEQEIQTIGFAFTKKEYRSQKLTHALINHVRLLHPRATIRMTTNQLISSMLRCCRNLGFVEYDTKDDRIFSSIKTCCEELTALCIEE